MLNPPDGYQPKPHIEPRNVTPRLPKGGTGEVEHLPKDMRVQSLQPDYRGAVREIAVHLSAARAHLQHGGDGIAPAQEELAQAWQIVDQVMRPWVSTLHAEKGP